MEFDRILEKLKNSMEFIEYHKIPIKPLKILQNPFGGSRWGLFVLLLFVGFGSVCFQESQEAFQNLPGGCPLHSDRM